MHEFHYAGNILNCERVSLLALAKKQGTPLYVYSQGTLTRHFQDLDTAMDGVDHMICYAVKANGNLGVLRTLADLGSGFDIVSAGELERVKAAGGDPQKCVFAGVGKTSEEIKLALQNNIYCLNVESEAELERINQLARSMRRVAPVALRVNPNVDAGTHAKITTGTYQNKFGIAFESIPGLCARVATMKHLRLRGLQMHIGSQLTEVQPFERAVVKVAPLAQQLARQYRLDFLSIGGGIGIVYRPALASGRDSWWRGKAGRQVITPAKYARALNRHLKGLGLKILLEPGRFIAGNAGVLLTKVEYVKRTPDKYFAIVDAAMSDLIRPSMYEAYHEIVPVRKVSGRGVRMDVVGPICETGDTFCRDRLLPPLVAGDYLALLSAGAYGFVMASTYNARPLAAELLVRGGRSVVVRPRQKLTDLWAGESLGFAQ